MRPESATCSHFTLSSELLTSSVQTSSSACNSFPSPNTQNLFLVHHLRVCPSWRWDVHRGERWARPVPGRDVEHVCAIGRECRLCRGRAPNLRGKEDVKGARARLKCRGRGGQGWVTGVCVGCICTSRLRAGNKKVNPEHPQPGCE